MTSHDQSQARTVSSRLRTVFDLLVTVAMLAVAGVIAWLIVRQPAAATPDPNRPREIATIEGIPTLGDPGAPLVMIVFSDFECDFCVKFAREIWPEFKTRWVETGQVQVAFRHLPMPDHLDAQRAAEAAECAARQDRFWPMHDVMFAGHPSLDEADLMAYAKEARLDTDVFEACMGEAPGEQISADGAIAASLRLDKPPMFLIGRLEPDRRVTLAGMMYGALPMSQFEQIVGKLSGK